jgi:hypothetical protein
MNINYVGSVAERFMKFRSTLRTEENVTENLFNAVSIYVPKSLASANLASGSYTPSEVTPAKYAVIPVTVDNYASVFAEGSEMLSQWLPVFNDGTNGDVTLYVIIFDDEDFAPTVTAKGIVWEPLSKAFKELYFISFFKTMFSESYDGSTGDENYFDMALALSALCAAEATLSMALLEIKAVIPEEGGEDTNACKILSHTRGEETTHCTTLVGSDVAARAEYFWGYVNLLGGEHTQIVLHNGNYMIPIVLGKWFEEPNATKQYIGNKLAKIRLSGSRVKPTGNPSPLNSDVNLNMPLDMAEVLDSKAVGYFISIADNSMNNAELVRERTVTDFPVTAYMISKWIDYNTSQDVAKFATASETLTNPVMVNQKTYSDIQGMLVANIQKFAGLGRLQNIVLDFPPFSEAKKGQWFEGTGVWKATYVDDLEGVEITGSISF